MADDKDSNGGAWARVPTWDGSPLTWRSFKREMDWWTSALDLNATTKYNLAARWLLRQSGVVRQRGEEFSPLELAHQPEVKGEDPQTKEEVVIVECDPLAGIRKLMAALETLNGRSSLDKKGELRNQFYLELKRRPGERISEFSSRFRVLVSELKTEGVEVASSELGWFYKTKLGLDPLRSQLLETALGGSEDYSTIEREVLRLFKDLHVQDPLARRPAGDGKAPLLQRFLSQQSSWGPSKGASSYAPSMASSAPRSFKSAASSSTTPSTGRFSSYRRPQGVQKSAFVSEAEPAEEPQDGDVVDEVEPQEGVSLEEVLAAEAEVLATELAEAADEGVDEEALLEIEESVGQAAEALLTMREAKTKLQEVKRDRGYGRAGGADQKGKMNPKKSSLKHPCFDCDLPGHWAGDPECKKPGQGLGRKNKGPPKQVKLAEALTSEVLLDDVGRTDVSTGSQGNEVLMVNAVPKSAISPGLLAALEQSHMEPKEVNVTASMALDKRLVGALDSACNRTCTGPEWLAGFLESLKKAPQPVRDLVTCRPEHEVFRFGNGGTQVSSERWRLPMCVGGELISFWTSVVQVPSLGLLLGRDFLEAVGAEMSFPRRSLVCAHLTGIPIKLKQLMAGHFLLELLPPSWPGVGSQRWKKLGIDGVIEVQMNTVDWLRKRISSKSHMWAKDHDHLLTEKSVKVGHLVCAVMSDVGSCGDLSPVQAPSSMPLRVAPTTRTTSSTTRSLPAELPLGDGALSRGQSDGQSMETIPDADRRARQVGRKRRSLWVLQRPWLRFLCLPYHSVTNLSQWRVQMHNQVSAGVTPRRYLEMAESQGKFTMANLSDCIQLRNRLGIKVAFCEDPVLTGMLAAQKSRGLMSRLRTAAAQEARAAAQKASAEGRRESEARALIGPRGGLPSLRGDLVKLAALLRVEVGEKDSIAQIKEKVKPMVELLKAPLPTTAVPAGKAKPKAASAKASAAPKSLAVNASERPFSALMDKQEDLAEMVQKMAQEIAMLRAQQGLDHGRASGDLEHMETEPSLIASLPEEPMWTEEEILRMNGEAYEELYSQRLAAQYGEERLGSLTREEIERATDL